MTEPAPIRVGVDVGGTFTKAVAVCSDPLELIATSTSPTSHAAADGVASGLADVLGGLLDRLGPAQRRVELVAYSTTTAMNALLEGDVAKVGIIGIGSGGDARLARRRSSIGEISLAPGRRLRTAHAFLDGETLSTASIDAALAGLVGEGCASIAVSGAYSVDDSAGERLVSERARARGLPACAGHELTGAYGLETRTVSAAINASILPHVERTAAVVEEVLAQAGVEVPLLVLKGDGGAMTLAAFRSHPSFTIGSGPAAGVAAALHDLGLDEGLVLECGGTSSNVSIVKRGRAVLRTLRVMERPTAIRTVDSWVVGAAGGSMGRLGRRKVARTGPRSAHLAGLPYACFADPAQLGAAVVESVAPRSGDPGDYAVLREGEGRWALTATCAAMALGTGRAPQGSREAALAGFEALGRRLRRPPQRVARQLLDGAVSKIAAAVDEAAKAHDFGQEVPLVALGGAGPVLAPEVADRLGRPLVSPKHPEVLSSIGAALSLIRTEVVRSATGGSERLRVTGEAQRECVDAGAAPHTVTVETRFEPDAGQVRAVATGAVALESGAAARREADEPACASAASHALALPAGKVALFARTDYYRVFSGNGSGGCAIVDGLGSVPFAERAGRPLRGAGEELIAELSDVVAAESVNLGLAEIAPRVALVSGPRIIDLSDARNGDDIVHAAREALAGADGEAVAVIWS